MNEKRFFRELLVIFAAAAMLGCLAFWTATIGAAEPQFVPIPRFVDVPAQAVTVEVPVTAEVAPKKAPIKKAVKKVWGIVGWSRACPSCPLQPSYGWVDEEVEEDSGEAKAEAMVEKLATEGVSKEEFAALEQEVPAKTIRKVLEQRWSIATCGMICASHGSRLYNHYDDGSVEPVPDEEQPATGESSGRRFRIFRRRQ